MYIRTRTATNDRDISSSLEMFHFMTYTIRLMSYESFAMQRTVFLLTGTVLMIKPSPSSSTEY